MTPSIPPDPAAQASRLARQLNAVLRELNALERRHICCPDITVQQCATLIVLQETGGTESMGELAEALGLAISTLTRNVSVLEKQGLVRRERATHDARVSTVCLTARGHTRAQELLAVSIAACEKILSQLTASHRAQVVELLDELVWAVSSLRSDPLCCT
ncbi:MAG: winged helix-turn-helix transcriptional regulator [Candidatus Schekmanbacteria bacterium]|nr:winged helix-turn-helix transcriptional regulator [Candidatus Schekmanbacteria bacterium]